MSSIQISPGLWRAIWQFWLQDGSENYAPLHLFQFEQDYPFSGETAPVTRQRWEALNWEAKWDKRKEPGDRPAWHDVLRTYANRSRGSNTLRIIWLREAYRERLALHIDGTHDTEADRIIDLMETIGENDHADAIKHWREHLYNRFLELRFSIMHASVEEMIGIVQCGHFTEARLWEGATWQWCDSLPIFDKQGSALAKIAELPPVYPPADVFIRQADPTRLQVHSTAAAVVALAEADEGAEPLLIRPTTLTYTVPGIRLVTLQGDRPDITGRNLQVGIVAYGQSISKTVPITRGK